MKPEKVALRYVGKEQTIQADQQHVAERAPAPRPGGRYAAFIAGSFGRHAAPLDQRAREDRYRKQTGRTNRCEAETEPVLEFFPPTERAHLLGLTPKQRRRSEKKAWHGDLVLRGLTT